MTNKEKKETLQNTATTNQMPGQITIDDFLKEKEKEEMQKIENLNLYLDRKKEIKCELYHDNFQNWKKYPIKKAQLIICDIPYNVGTNFYGSNPTWYIGGDRKNGESKKAGKNAFNCDGYFNITEYFAFCNRLLIKDKNETVQRGKSSNNPSMLIFCALEQVEKVKEIAKKYGFKNSIQLFFIKNYSPQVLKANMRVVGAVETALLLYRDKLPKFRNDGHMVFNWFQWNRDNSKEYPKIHPTQKPVNLLKRLIEIFTDPGDVVIDPCAGSGTTLRAAYEMGRSSFGFEIDRRYYSEAKEKMLNFDEMNAKKNA